MAYLICFAWLGSSGETVQGNYVEMCQCRDPYHLPQILLFVHYISDTKYITYPLKFLDYFKVRSKVLVRRESVPLKLKPTTH